MTVLIAEDNKELSKVLKGYFLKDDYSVFTAYNGEEALDIFYNEKVDLVILDWMMPMKNGITVCREIKENSNAKVLILTAKSQIEDEITALETGADDYMKKPFDPRVLLTRANRLVPKKEVLTLKNIKLALNKGKIFVNDIEIDSTLIEYNLLKYFLLNRGQVITREQLLNKIWGYDYVGTDRTVDTHIRRLRKKIGEDIIKTYRGMGYGIDA